MDHFAEEGSMRVAGALNSKGGLVHKMEYYATDTLNGVEFTA